MKNSSLTACGFCQHQLYRSVNCKGWNLEQYDSSAPASTFENVRGENTGNEIGFKKSSIGRTIVERTDVAKSLVPKMKLATRVNPT